MPSVFESSGQDNNGPPATLLTGLRVLARNQEIPFRLYERRVLPLDGYVFWLGAGGFTIQGSLHYTTDQRQNEDETIAINRIVLTTGEEVQRLNQIEPDSILVGEYAGLRFAFSGQSNRFKPAGDWHYFGDAVYPALQSQLMEVGADLLDREPIVSNSLPAWLQLREYDPVWLNAPNPRITLYPSFLVPANLRPPYGTVHVDPQQTQVLQAFPALDRRTTSQHQLTTDRVRVTLYGLNNRGAMDFVNLVNQFSEDTDSIGMMAPAAIRDEKRTQAELGIIAMKKSVEYVVSYQQGVMRDTARALIEHASATIIPQQE